LKEKSFWSRHILISLLYSSSIAEVWSQKKGYAPHITRLLATFVKFDKCQDDFCQLRK